MGIENTGIYRVVAVGSGIWLASCSLILDTSKVQCTRTEDCVAKGSAFASAVCSADGLCMASDGNVASGGAVVELKAGHYHSCVRVDTGDVYCWGKNEFGQTGNGRDPGSNPVIRTAAKVMNVAEAVALALGEDHSCAVLKSGSVKCWGGGSQGQLGNGKFESSPTPVEVQLPGPAQAVGAGAQFSCAVLRTGEVYCWGSNAAGQLGNGKGPDEEPRSATPSLVGGISATAVGGGEEYACALLGGDNAGKVACWGTNDSGQLGIGSSDAGKIARSATARVVVNLTNAASISLGEKHACAVTTEKTVACWGENTHGQLAAPMSIESWPSPREVPDVEGVRESSAGGDHVCVRTTDASLICWGSNGSGELGSDPKTLEQTEKPLELPGMSDVQLLSSGDEHTCVKRTSGSVFCWGRNNQGQFGDGTTIDSSLAPVQVTGL